MHARRGAAIVMPALYISDLDGTLLRNDARLSDYSRAALRELLGDGVPFSVASARSVASMRPILRGLRLELPVVALNGAFLSDLESGRHEIVNSIERDVAEDLYRAILSFECVPLLATFDGKAECLYHQEAANEGMRWFLDDRIVNRDERLRRAENLADALAEQVVCMTVIGLAAQLTEIDAALRERHGPMIETHFFENSYSPGWHWLTVHDRRATKAEGVRTLVERFGLAGKELVVFGDHVNDVKLFEIAAHAVAVSNAEETVKRIATRVIGSNEEDSVVNFIRDDWRSRKAGSRKTGF
ncbi:MAG TPA: HAD family hydrolase [Gammaproteobacteria bacterium]|nr:HAD family hydrolase [Gammaproteobacteria bacterium]